jgi:hypothetical protein
MRTGDVVNLTVVADGHVVHDGLEPLLTFVPARAGTDNERYRNGTAKVQYYSEQCRATEAARDRNGTGTVQERYRNGTVLQRAAQCCKDSTGQGRNRNGTATVQRRYSNGTATVQRRYSDGAVQQGR